MHRVRRTRKGEPPGLPARQIVDAIGADAKLEEV
jgi:hypothetical protein